MEKVLGATSSAASALGAAICLLSGLTRLSGSSYFAGFESMTLFMGGIGLMVFGISLKLELIYNTKKR